MNILSYLFLMFYSKKEVKYDYVEQSQQSYVEPKPKGHLTGLGKFVIIIICFISFYIGWVYVYPSVKNYYYPTSSDEYGALETIGVNSWSGFAPTVTFNPTVTVYDTNTGLHYDVTTTEDLSKCSLVELKQKMYLLRKQVLKEQLKVVKFNELNVKTVVSTKPD